VVNYFDHWNKPKVMAFIIIASQFVYLMSFPFITKMYTPEEFGVFSILAMLSGLFAVVGGGEAGATSAKKKFKKD